MAVFDDSFEHEVQCHLPAISFAGVTQQCSERAGIHHTVVSFIIAGPDPDIGFWRSRYQSNSGDEGGERVVLLVDVWHPELTEAERACISRLFAAEQEAGATDGDERLVPGGGGAKQD